MLHKFNPHINILESCEKNMKKIKKVLAFLKPYYIINLVVTESVTQKIKNARLAQLVEHLTLNQGVQGSNLIAH